MVRITELYIISIDKSDDSWAIEGEVIFEEDLSSGFEVTYNLEEDELEDLILEVDPGKYNKNEFKALIIKAVNEFDE